VTEDRKAAAVTRATRTTPTRRSAPGGRLAVLGVAIAVASLALVAAPAGAAVGAKKKTGTPVVVEVGDTAGTTAPMTMTVTPASVPAGKVTITVKNSGTVIHEMVILKTDTPYDQLPVVKDTVNEAASVGEVSNIPKGKSKSGTFTLKPGKYVLVCNIKKHYGLGMRAPLTVT